LVVNKLSIFTTQTANPSREVRIIRPIPLMLNSDVQHNCAILTHWLYLHNQVCLATPVDILVGVVSTGQVLTKREGRRTAWEECRKRSVDI